MGTLKKNHADLPKAVDADTGNPPSLDPGPIVDLFRTYHEQFLARDERPTATGTKLRASWAGRCSRQIQYRLLGVEGEPPDVAGAFAMDRGKIVHELLDSHASAKGWQVEMPVQVSENLSATVDFVTPDNETLELKTTGGYSFKMKATPERGPAEGPGHGDVLQALLGAYGLDANHAWITYVSMEPVSQYLADRWGFSSLGRFVASWGYDREQIVALAKPEVFRLEQILADTTAGREVPRTIPLDAERTVHFTARNGSWEQRQDGNVVDVGKTWACDYCPFREECWS